MDMAVSKPQFSSTWWDNFLQETQQLSAPAVFKDCFSKNETALMRRQVLEILAEISRLRSSKYGLRMWVNGAQEKKLDSLFDCPPQEGDTLEQWVARMFGDKKFGIILNQGERFNNAMSKYLAYKLAPLLEKIGMPTEGVFFNIFIGNYDNTPLGIHQDELGRCVMHFHLGPGSKTMYTWNNEDYLKKAGSTPDNNFDYDTHLPDATKLSFDEGEVYFMPENCYHLGTQEGLSIGIACWCYNRAANDLANSLYRLVRASYLKKDSIMLKADKNPPGDTSNLDSTLALFDFPQELQALTMKDLFRATFKDLRYAIYSNAGYRHAPLPLKGTVPISEQNAIAVEQPYRIQYRDSDSSGELVMFVRGTCLRLRKFDCIVALLDQINTGEVIPVASIIEKFGPDFPRPALIHLLNLLRQHHGISIL